MKMKCLASDKGENMYTKERKLMQRISNYCGDRVDYVQGGGGNTSVKFDARMMAIKASGYTLKETKADKGYVTVDYQKIKKYYNDVDTEAGKDFEKESLEVNMNSIVLLDGMEERRPSVEVGMHSFLERCVIHTHAVYANIVCCCGESRQLAKEIFADAGFGYVFVPYIDPGFRLTLAVRDAAKNYSDENCSMPDVIFMENHGVITTSDDAQEAMELHEKVNNGIIKRFELSSYPEPRIKKVDDGFESDTSYLLEFSKNHGGQEYFEKLKLYPDQLVYIGKALTDVIKFEDGRIIYRAAEKEAKVIEETMLGVVYVVGQIEKYGLHINQMDEKGAAFINNWESEKYRSKLVKQKEDK
jgi:rhamnose utilization protein RhaD (predicted bifunctional aldolase and dehydrogenase)